MDALETFKEMKEHFDLLTAKITEALQEIQDLYEENRKKKNENNQCKIRGHRHLQHVCKDCGQVVCAKILTGIEHWISVKERMPKIKEFPNNDVLTWNGVEITARTYSFYETGKCYFNDNGNPNITHWMPFPEDPK